MPLLSVLGVVFVTLKLMGYIMWSWAWVLLPFYGPAIVLLVILLLGMLGTAGYQGKTKRRW